MDQRLSLRGQYAMIDEYGAVLIDTVRVTPEECKAAFNAMDKSERATFNAISPGSDDPRPGDPVTADDWLKQGAMGMVKIHLEAIGDNEYYKRMMAQPDPDNSSSS
jgi:hypothetical protein